MLVSTSIVWQSVDWPTAGATASTYAVFDGASDTPVTGLASVTDLTATVTYDDTTVGKVYLVRPTDGTDYGPAQGIFVGVGPMNNRAWFRTMIRQAISDRIDTNIGNTPTIADDELNSYLNDAIRKYSSYFPREKQQMITLVAAQRDYVLPADFQEVLQLRYQSVDSQYRVILREEPFKGGETTPTSWVGYPKLGIYQPVWGGRFYSGHYEIHDDGTGTLTLSLDFDPPGDGDTMLLRYRCAYGFPASDLDPLSVPVADIEGLGLYVQAKAWVQIEARDVSLSRWRSKEDGARRDDLPTEKMSTRMFNAWNVWIAERQSLRPRNIRLVRRT